MVAYLFVMYMHLNHSLDMGDGFTAINAVERKIEQIKSTMHLSIGGTTTCLG